MLILNVGSVMGANFDQIMNLRTDATASTVCLQVIHTYVYDMGVSKGQYDLSTAIGLFQQAVNCVLLFGSNFVVQEEICPARDSSKKQVEKNCYFFLKQHN